MKSETTSLTLDHLENNLDMMDDEDREAFKRAEGIVRKKLKLTDTNHTYNNIMTKHKKLLNEKFSHATDDLLYNSGGNVMWSLFRFESGSVTIYYHNSENFHILSESDARWHSLTEIADNWDLVNEEILI